MCMPNRSAEREPLQWLMNHPEEALLTCGMVPARHSLEPSAADAGRARGVGPVGHPQSPS
jgi:hypothetical protein